MEEHRLDCPEDAQLVAIACGESDAPEVLGHAEHCSACRERLESLREVREALRGMARAQTSEILEKAVPAISSVPGSSDGEMHDRPARIGKYTVVSFLGSGGQADVYRAVHPVLGKDVVIKIGRHAAARAPAEVKRLEEEGRLLAQLSHPHLSRVYDLDFHDGRPYLVLEYLQGRSLARLAQDEPLSARRAAEVVAKVARALAAAHRQGVVHRDIKPENILLGEDGEPRLIDFGIALLRGAWTEDGPRPREISGTLEFMAPEQARGETERVGPRSDVFSLGAVLYYLLVGRGPFAAASFGASIERARRCEFDLQALARAPRRLARICLKALAAEPQDRHASAEELARALEGRVRPPLRLAATAAASVLVLAGLAAFFLLPARGFRVEEHSLWRLLPDGPRRVLDGERIEEGDQLFLRFEADRPLYLYVLNEDDRGHRMRLFPNPKLKQRNPLAGGVTHILPHGDGASASWKVVSSGGRESLLVVASLTPIPEIEKEEVVEVSAAGVREILRGMDLVIEPETQGIAEGKGSLASVVEELKRSADEGRATSGQWVRKITLFNP